MAISREFIDLLKAKLSVVEVVSRYVPLHQKGATHWGCCPFHKEKTPSFSVSEAKGFYHCFGCGAHGTAIDFVMQHQRMSFPEAIEKLAAEAGLEMPKFSAAEAKRAEQSKTIYDVLAMAGEFYQKVLFEDEGAEALSYLRRRGLDDEIIARFKLGFAPAGNRLYKSLLNKGVAPEQMLAAGLCKKSEKDGSIYDYFRGRVMFSITDPRGRVVAFGGRVLDQGEPKYLNSPESIVFNKGANLYALAIARANVSVDKPIIACEGYMDTISLHKFGFDSAVAPLGTAMTETQIEMLWRICDEPILCMDNDTAGRGAAVRAAMRALPILKAGKSLRFCLLSGAKDPDEFLNMFGAEKLNEEFGRALPLSDVVWNSLLEGRIVKTPEQKAGLNADVLKILGGIRDESVRALYLDDFKKRMKKEFGRIAVAAPVIAPKKTPENANERMVLAFACAYPMKLAKLVEDGFSIVLCDAKFKKILDFIVGETRARPHTRDTLSELLAAKGFVPAEALAFEYGALVAKPETAENIIREKALAISREVLRAEIEELSRKMVAASCEGEQSELNARIKVLRAEIEKVEAAIAEIVV
ncbi:MAG: DNA primase [Alphaproteobacteria bacterium]|nr:DNA primase [Alphaproteobacteria bacterium]